MHVCRDTVRLNHGTPLSSHGRRRVAALRAMLVCALAIATNAAGAQPASRRDGGQVLEGRWSIQLLLDSASARQEPSQWEARGELAFASIPWLGSADRFGRHSVDLRPFFGRSFTTPMTVTPFTPADTSFLTEVSGGVTRDSVAIDFIPRLNHYGVSLRGRYFGDSARGKWYRRGSDGAGRFVLRRISREPVGLVGIPDPTRATTAVATTAPTTTPTTAPKGAARSVAQGRSIPKKAATVATTVATTSTTPPPAAATAPTTTAANAPATSRATTAAATPAPAQESQRPDSPPPPQPAAGPSATGGVRVRMLDKTSQRWFVTTYQLRLPNGQLRWGNMRSGPAPDGWGPVVRQPPGRYDVMVENFVCGDKFWFFAKKVLRPVVVRPGETTDLTIELDLWAEPAKVTMDNKTGARCLADPGTPP